jgi:predicted nuclease of predicted toxin-antitoxin system
MKILFDQNISNRIVAKLSATMPDSTHIKSVGLTDASDYEIFMYAREQGYDVVVSRDDDLIKLVNQFGHPPKIIHLRTGNANTNSLAAILNKHKDAIIEFITDTNQSILIFFD